MRIRSLLVFVIVVAMAFPSVSRAAEATLCDGGVCGSVSPLGVTLQNSVAVRTWAPGLLVTRKVGDTRPGGALHTASHRDFSLILDHVQLGSERFHVTDVRLDRATRGGVRVTFTATLTPLLTVVRTVEAYPGIAGFATRTILKPLIPLVLSGYTLDEVAVGHAAATIQAFRAGADWREPSWKPRSIGDPHTGDWRATATAPFGSSLRAPGEWLSLAAANGARTFLVTERRDYASSRMTYDGKTGASLVDLSRDVIYIGPFEETAHIENPVPLGPARHRVFVPGTATELERVFTGFGLDRDDEPWQFYKYLTGHRLTPYPKAVTFNTNPIDENAISTGAKDDANFDRFARPGGLADAARQMGVETFVFDDGWQAASGDWCPDSDPCPEPRRNSDPQKFRARFPDATFAAVRGVLAGDPSDPSDDMSLGLWMNPMEFNPAANAFKTNPQWSCFPTGTATAIANLADPNSGSNEAGIGVWNPAAIGRDPDTKEPTTMLDFLEKRIRREIDVYGARYFKFDFLVWADCVGVAPVDMYAYHDLFVAMLDRLQADHPDVTFQIDETNDYRLFPFESVARGPSWFQNGAPDTNQLLHNLWDLAPYVPGFSIGQHALGNRSEIVSHRIDYCMSVALGSHITFWTDIDTALTAVQRAEVKRWTDFYKANRDEIATFTYPLLGDPLTSGWAALQPWDPDAGRGFLLAYRQGGANATQQIGLRGVRGNGSFALTLVDPATGAVTSLGTSTAAALRAGIDVTIDHPYGYALIRIEPA